MTEPLVRNVSDTALWVAYYRALESERPDARFKDPFARRLAGERGEQIAKTEPFLTRHSWSMVARTVLFDRYVSEEVGNGADLIINLAAGLDTRPYRLDLPASLRWVEVDLPAILDYKEEVLEGAVPRCTIERVRLDLSDEEARHAQFARITAGARRAVVLTEGLLVYFEPAQVGSLARDLFARPEIHAWVVDIASPGLVKMMLEQRGAAMGAADRPFKFGPAEGPAFFTTFGWRVESVSSMLHEAAKLKRLPFWMRLFALFPDREPRPPKRPWSGVVRLTRD